MTKTDDYFFYPVTQNAFVARYVAWRKASSDAPLEYAETLAVAALSGITGKRLQLHIRQIPRPVNCNLYVALVGPSTLGRKSNSIDACMELLVRVGMSQSMLLEPGSPEGLVQDLERHDKGSILEIDELAAFMKKIKTANHMKSMHGYLLSAYDGKTIALRNKAKPTGKDGELKEDSVVAVNPALTLLAAATPDRLTGVSGPDDLEDGWWPRWALCWPQRLPPRQDMDMNDSGQDSLRDALVIELRRMHERLGDGMNAFLNEEARVLAAQYARDLEEMIETDEQYGSLYGRADIRLFKVAALLALASPQTEKGPIEIRAENVEDSYGLVRRWLYDAKLLMEKLGTDQDEMMVQRAYKWAKQHGPVVRRYSVHQAMHFKARIFDDLEKTLKDRNLIEVVEVGRHQCWALTDVDDEPPNETVSVEIDPRLKSQVDELLSRMNE